MNLGHFDRLCEVM